MNTKKLLVLMIAPLFVVGMAACGTDEPAADDVWTEEGQLPAYEAEDPAMDPALDETEYEMEDDTVIVPDADEADEVDEEETLETEGDAEN